MADHNSLAHVFVSAKADGTDATLVKPSDWNKEHRFAGGTNGQQLTWDSTQTDFVKWASSGIVDVTAPPYNVPSDGVTDCRTAISSMLTTIGSNGAVLYFPPGFYVTSSGTLPLIAVTQSNLTLLGVRGKSILRQNGASNVVTVTGSSVSFIGLGIDGNNNGAAGIYGTNTVDLQVRECDFTQLKGNCVLLDGASTINPTIRDCYMTSGATMTAPQCVRMSAGGGLTVQDVYFHGTNYTTALDVRGCTGTTVIGCYYDTSFSTNANIFDGVYTEIGTWYDTAGGLTAFIWDWQADVKLTLIGIRATLTTGKISNYSTRNLGKLTVFASGDFASNVPLLATVAGSSLQGQYLAQGMLSSQVSAGGIGNGADTTDDTLFTYTVPQNAWDANGRVLRIEVSVSTAVNGNNKRFSLFFQGISLVTSGPITWNALSATFTFMLTRTDATHIQGYMYWVNSAGAVGQTRIASSVVSNLTNTNSAVAFTGASQTTGAANDCLAYSYQACWAN